MHNIIFLVYMLVLT